MQQRHGNVQQGLQLYVSIIATNNGYIVMSIKKLSAPVSKYQRIFADLSKTESLSTIGRQYGISKQRVSFLIKHGAGSVRKCKKIDGVSLKEYCRRHGLRYWAVRKYVYGDNLTPKSAVARYYADIGREWKQIRNVSSNHNNKRSKL